MIIAIAVIIAVLLLATYHIGAAGRQTCPKCGTILQRRETVKEREQTVYDRIQPGYHGPRWAD